MSSYKSEKRPVALSQSLSRVAQSSPRVAQELVPFEEVQTCLKRFIYVLHLVNKASYVLTIQNTECSSRDLASYDVKYKALAKNTTSFQEDFEVYIQELLNQIERIPIECTALLIVNIATETFENFRDDIASYIPDELRKNTTIYNFGDPETEENPSRKKRHYFSSIPPIKIKNIMFDDKSGFGIRSLSKIHLQVPVEFFDDENPYLDCVWWFKYYLSNAFGCARGRYQQVSGTCYLNACINGFIISNYSQKALMLELKNSDPMTQGLAKKPIELNPGICYNPAYFWRLFYNAVCRRVDYNVEGLNIEDKKWVRKDLLIDYATKYHTGESGLSYNVLPKLFELIFKRKIMEVTNTLDSLYIYSPPSPLIYDLITREFFSGKDFPQIRPITTTGTLDENGTKMDDQKIIYDPDWCIITIGFVENEIPQKPVKSYWETFTGFVKGSNSVDEMKTSAHSIIGYKCNGICKAYDSNNYFYDFDWENITDTNIDKFFLSLFDNYNSHVNVFMIESVVYIRKDMKPQLDKINIEDLCSSF